MISLVTGKLIACELVEVIVDVHGIGLALSVPMSTYDKMPRVGESVQLFTHLHVREDNLQLFGFATTQERLLFKLLISVSGVGPKLALSILSSMSVQQFCNNIVNDNIKGLTKISGIGKRSAERLLVELRDKVAKVDPAVIFSGTDDTVAVNNDMSDAMAALETLGFKHTVAQKTVQNICKELPAEQQTSENIIRKALAMLNS